MYRKFQSFQKKKVVLMISLSLLLTLLLSCSKDAYLNELPPKGYPDHIGIFNLTRVDTAERCEPLGTRMSSTPEYHDIEICYSYRMLNYEEPTGNKSLVILENVTKGIEMVEVNLRQFSKPKMIHGQDLFSLEKEELLWYPNRDGVNLIVVIEGVHQVFGPATGNDVTKWFLDHYPPIPSRMENHSIVTD